MAIVLSVDLRERIRDSGEDNAREIRETVSERSQTIGCDDGFRSLVTDRES